MIILPASHFCRLFFKLVIMLVRHSEKLLSHNVVFASGNLVKNWVLIFFTKATNSNRNA
jgi:hypothetical protein